MAYAYIVDGAVSVYPCSMAQFQTINPSVSLPAEPTEDQLNEVGLYTIIPTPVPSYNPVTENCAQGTPECHGLQWVQKWVVTPATPDEIAARQAQAKEDNKQQAEILLQESDWTQQPDVDDPTNPPYLTNKDAFKTYRAALRVIALNPPVTVTTWPTLPEEQWSN